MTDFAIQATGVSIGYGRKTVVHNASIEVPYGVTAGFLGPNGHGKTTFMSVLAGTHRRKRPGLVSFLTAARLNRERDSIYMLGKQVPRELGKLFPQGRVGLMVGGVGVDPSLTGSQALRLRRGSACRTAEVLREVGLWDNRDVPVKAYSQGMRQRLGLATALLKDPELLILDEPDNGLDPEYIKWLRSSVLSHQQGRTVLVSSHQLREMEDVCNYVIFIQQGRIIYQGWTHDLLQYPVPRYVLRFSPHDQARVLAFLDRIGASVTRSDKAFVEVETRLSGHELNKGFAEQGVFLGELISKQRRLEDAYQDLMQTEEVDS